MNIKEARQSSKMTQEEVAGYLGISRVTYGKMERDPELITLCDAKALSELFGIPLEDIFSLPTVIKPIVQQKKTKGGEQ